VTVGTFDKRIKTYDLRMNNNDDSGGVGVHVEDFKVHRLPVLSVLTNPNDSNQVLRMKGLFEDDGTFKG
jgi:hypothetical protein